MTSDPLNQRVIERKVYEEVVEIIVDMVYKEFGNDEAARLRIYTLISDNFRGMVKCLKPQTNTSNITNLEYVYEDPHAVE